MINLSKVRTIHFRSNGSDARYSSVSVSNKDSLEEIDLNPSVSGMKLIVRKDEGNRVTAVIPGSEALTSSYTYKIGVKHDN